ncbi:unnamed protein product [Amoebophrya sp. A120]|nr:unnamed protein product [Amoebophrya sp. A120]|eukprot:GSA120T00013242001.1
MIIHNPETFIVKKTLQSLSSADSEFSTFCTLAGIGKKDLQEPLNLQKITVFGNTDSATEDVDPKSLFGQLLRSSESNANIGSGASASHDAGSSTSHNNNNPGQLTLPLQGSQSVGNILGSSAAAPHPNDAAGTLTAKKNFQNAVASLKEYRVKIPPLREIAQFKNLKELTIVQQNLSTINSSTLQHNNNSTSPSAGASSAAASSTDQLLPHLQKLVLNENNLTNLKGLHLLTRQSLKHLYVSHNKIRNLHSDWHLKLMTRLETFWIADNLLTSLAGTHYFPQLQDLNVAGNMIDNINILFLSKTVKKLNLSGNLLYNFADLIELSKFPGQFTELSFSSPDWGRNPICLLQNYEMFVLRYLGWQLQFLDEIKVADVVASGSSGGNAGGTVKENNKSGEQGSGSTTAGTAGTSADTTTKEARSSTSTSSSSSTTTTGANQDGTTTASSVANNQAAVVSSSATLRQAEIAYLKKRLFYSMRDNLDSSAIAELNANILPLFRRIEAEILQQNKGPQVTSSFSNDRQHRTSSGTVLTKELCKDLQQLRVLYKFLQSKLSDLARRDTIAKLLELESVALCAMEPIANQDHAFKKTLNDLFLSKVFPQSSSKTCLAVLPVQISRVRNRFWQMRVECAQEKMHAEKETAGWLKGVVFTSHGPVWPKQKNEDEQPTIAIPAPSAVENSNTTNTDATTNNQNQDATGGTKVYNRAATITLPPEEPEYLFLSCGDSGTIETVLRHFSACLDHQSWTALANVSGSGGGGSSTASSSSTTSATASAASQTTLFPPPTTAGNCSTTSSSSYHLHSSFFSSQALPPTLSVSAVQQVENYAKTRPPQANGTMNKSNSRTPSISPTRKHRSSRRLEDLRVIPPTPREGPFSGDLPGVSSTGNPLRPTQRTC